MAKVRLLAVAAAMALITTLLSGPVHSAAATPTPFSVHGSAQQVYVTGLAPAASMSLLDPSGKPIATQQADSLGGVLFRNVPPGAGYRARLNPSGPVSDPVTVYSDQPAPWDPGIYNQPIANDGYQYLTTRDGTKLAITVHPPTHPASVPGLPALPTPPPNPLVGPPWPTLVEYSGYGYANPSGPDNGIAVLANLMGFAVVDVNMRGTGCSGGAYDFFEPLQNLDGYDVIETIAHQPWVLGNKVGMMGISYGAISQLFTAQTTPPDLAAISPLSTLDATATTLYPGGILNTGFAVGWAKERQQQAQPAGVGDSGTQAYAEQRVAQGDQVCKANQVLHGEAADLLAKIAANQYYVPAVADPLDPTMFVDKINVPVFMACQWEDEQTGGHCPDLVPHFTGTSQKWFTFTNGAHIDSLDPATLNRWYDFMELFVAHRAPLLNPFAAVFHAAAPYLYNQAMGVPLTDTVVLPFDPVQLQLTYEGALAQFDQAQQVTVNFDNGAGLSPLGRDIAGDPYAAFSAGFPSLPVPGSAARSWYFAPGGGLSDQPPAGPAGNGTDSFTANAGATPLTDWTGDKTGAGGLWGNASQWQWNWQQNPPGSAVSYVSAPLPADTAAVGAGAVYAWVRSQSPNVDLQATVSEVSPSGTETFVQNGWIRGNERKLSTNTANELNQPSTPVEPVPTFQVKDVQPLPSNQFVEVPIPLYFQGHVYRAGTRIRVTISAPNGTQPVWSFSQTQPGSPTGVAVAFSGAMPSRLVLPIVGGVTAAPTPAPACPSLRNEPCRPFVAG